MDFNNNGTLDVEDLIFTEMILEDDEKETEIFREAMMNHEEPICPQCGKGKIVCPQGKIPKPHFLECTNKCGWTCNIDYSDTIIE